jgi:glycosyltransferase involved in cell wall biosynthesis
VDGGIDGVELVGQLDDLREAYAQARVVINPAVAGTGLKIKTVEALAHLRPVVAWPAGVDGLDPMARQFCVVVRDWYGFAQGVLRVLAEGGARGLFEHRRDLERQLSPDSVYAALRDAIEEGIRESGAGRRGG